MHLFISAVVLFRSREHIECGPQPGFVRAHIESTFFYQLWTKLMIYGVSQDFFLFIWWSFIIQVADSKYLHLDPEMGDLELKYNTLCRLIWKDG